MKQQYVKPMNQQHLSRPDAAFRQIEKRFELINTLSDVWDTRPVSLWWHPGLNVFSASRDLSSYWKLTGGANRIRREGERLLGLVTSKRDGQKPYHCEVHLPEDAVILGPHRPRGPVIVSDIQGMALKWISRRPHLRGKFANEIESLQIRPHLSDPEQLPRLYHYGSHNDVADWLMTEFIPNKRPFQLLNSSLGWLTWLSWLDSNGLPFLWEFYSANRLEAKPLVDFINSDPDLINDHLQIDNFHHALDLPLVKSRIHGDLSGNHVHRHQSRFAVIDWGESRHDYVFRDLLYTYWRNPTLTKPGCQPFWSWLADSHQPTPKFITIHLKHRARATGIDISPCDFKSQLKIIMLDDILLEQSQDSLGERTLDGLTDRDRVVIGHLTNSDAVRSRINQK